MDLKILFVFIGTIILCMVITTSAKCKDHHRCGTYKAKYGCDNPSVKKICCQSCQVCKDTSKWCKYYKSYCSPGNQHSLWAKSKSKQIFAWAKKNCRKTCGLCVKARCMDKRTYCQRYKKLDYCNKKRGAMERNCRKTCGFCIPDNEINSESCGYKEDRRIVGGIDARAGDWKWQVSIAFRKKTKNVRCGGTLITNQWVLTARHCFSKSEDEDRDEDGVKKNIFVTLGDTDLYKQEGREITMKIAKVVFHEDYSVATGDNDLTLLKLEKPVTFNSFIAPACLPTSVKPVQNYRQCFITGWGQLGTNKKGATVLQQAEVPLVDRNKCNEDMMINRDISISEKLICAGYGNGGSDTCKGDSGGPLVCTEKSGKNKRFELVGVTNFGSTKCGSTYGIYARVSMHIGWIKNAIKS